MPDPRSAKSTSTSNAYEKWLGIPQEHQPPDFYRLLGVAPLEENLDTIAAAVEKRRADVLPHLEGPYRRAAEKLLRQIEHVSEVLSSPERKKEYDRKLRLKRSTAVTEQRPAIELKDVETTYLRRQKKPQSLFRTYALVVGPLALILLIVISVGMLSRPAISLNRLPPDEEFTPNKITTSISDPDSKFSEDSELRDRSIVFESDPTPQQSDHNLELPKSRPKIVKSTPVVIEKPRDQAGAAQPSPETLSSNSEQRSLPTSSKTPEETLAQHGLIVEEERIKSVHEGKFHEGFKKLLEHEEKLKDAERARRSLRGKLKDLDRKIAGLQRLLLRTNGKVRTLNPNDVLGNNKLVAKANQIRNKIDLEWKEREEIQKKQQAARSREFTARADFVKQFSQLKITAELLEQNYAAFSEESSIKSAVALLNENRSETTPLVLKYPLSLADNLQRFTTMEAAIQTEKIPLRRTPSGGMYVAVVLGEAEAMEMVLDSGASLICLPQKFANKVGVSAKPSDPKIKLQLADGRVIDGTATVISQVRVGRFDVKNVEAVILGPDATNAEPLLGMSFLEPVF